MITFIEIGRLGKVLGVHGSLVIHLDQKYRDAVIKEGVVFTDMKGSKVPFFIEEMDVDAEVIKFEDVNTPEEAVEISGQAIYGDQARLGMEPQSGPDPHALHGFAAYSEDTFIGNITDIIEYPQQIMLQITHDEKEYLIPFVAEFIAYANPEENTLHLDLPEGILEL